MMVDFVLQVAKTSLFTSLLIGLLLLLVPLLQKRYRAKWRYAVWIVIAIRLIVPFTPTLPQPPVRIELPEQTKAILSPRTENAVQSASIETKEQAMAISMQDVTAVSALAPKVTLSLEQIAFFVWLVGVLLFLLFQIGIYQIFLRRLKYARKESMPSSIRDMAWQIGKEMGICRLPEPIITDAVEAPVLIGVLHPRILLPHTRYTEQEISFVLRHELIHFRRRDMWYKLIVLLANAIHWFNPLVYLMTIQAAKDIELSCDDDVVKELILDVRVQYGETILSVLPKKKGLEPMFSTQFGSTKRNMKNRLRNLLDMNNKRRGIVALCVVIAFALSFTGMVTFGYAATVSSNNAIHAMAVDGTWAAASGIEGKTWQQQIDAEIKWLDDTYWEHKDNFTITESLPKSEMYDVSRVRYLYDNSQVFRTMSQMNGGVFQVENEQSFSRFGSGYNPDMMQRAAVMVDNNHDLTLDINYSLTQGKLAVWLIDPAGKAAYASDLSQSEVKTVTIKGAKGLWSVVTVNEGAEGDYIQGSISIVLRQLGSGQRTVSSSAPFSIERLGQHSFQDGDTLQANLSWVGNGSLMLLYTDKNYTDDEILVLLQGASGVPMPDYSKVDQTKIGDILNFSQSATSPLVWNDTSTKPGSYYFYLLHLNQPSQITGSVNRKNRDGTTNSIWIPATNVVSNVQNTPDSKPDTKAYDKECIRMMDDSGTWSDSINRLLPHMSPSGVEQVVNIYLDRHLFPNITGSEGARRVATTIATALNYMTKEAQETANNRIAAYY